MIMTALTAQLLGMLWVLELVLQTVAHCGKNTQTN